MKTRDDYFFRLTIGKKKELVLKYLVGDKAAANPPLIFNANKKDKAF